jgi:hypothetical protein
MLCNNEVHLWDLSDKVYIKIKDKCRKDFFDYLLKTADNVHNLAGLIGKNTIYSFRKYERGEVSISLKLVKEMVSILNENQKNMFMNYIEKNLKKVKFGLRKAKSIRNPSFPIIFSPILARIAGHLVGDGGIYDKDYDQGVYYTNKSDALINQFKEDILNVFGDVDFKIFEDKRGNIKTIKFPSIIGLILTTFFGHQIRNLKHVPKIIIDSEKITKAYFLRSLYDDESSVYKNKIQIFMSNKDVIEDVKEILKIFEIKPGKIQKINGYENTQPQFGFSICSGIDLTIFNREIVFGHPEKKKKLKLYLKKYKTFKHRRYEFRNSIISTLKENGSMNIFDLAEKLNQKSIKGFRKELWRLERRNLIKSVINRGKLNRNIKFYYV